LGEGNIEKRKKKCEASSNTVDQPVGRRFDADRGRGSTRGRRLRRKI
jgi:hypothetical protein